MNMGMDNEAALSCIYPYTYPYANEGTYSHIYTHMDNEAALSYIYSYIYPYAKKFTYTLVDNEAIFIL